MQAVPAPARRERMSAAGRAFDIAARRALARSGAIHRLAKSGPMQLAIQTVRASRQLERPLRFAVRQFVSRGIATYRVRESGLAVVMRHGSPDVRIVNEIYGDRIYELPAEAAKRLAALDRPPVALDLGGNIGLFGTWFFGVFPAGRVTTFEPDPGNAQLVRRAIAANGLEGRWDLVEACASNADGETAFVAGDYFNSRIPDAAEAGTITVPTRDVLELARDVDLLKVDIEGAEWSLLADPRFAALEVPVITMEWHIVNAPVPAAEARRAAMDALTGAGYEIYEPAPAEPHSGTLWAWR